MELNEEKIKGRAEITLDSDDPPTWLAGTLSDGTVRAGGWDAKFTYDPSAQATLMEQAAKAGVPCKVRFEGKSERPAKLLYNQRPENELSGDGAPPWEDE